MRRKSIIIATISCFALAGFGIGVWAGQESSDRSAQQSPAANPSAGAYVPAYHAEAPKGPLPQTIDPKEFPDALNQNIYTLATDAKLKRILYQQPCYCGCDRTNGHKSLLDCYVDHHASVCGTCRREAVYAYEQSRKGKTAAQIRQGIIDGEWKDVDLAPYATPAASK